MKNTEHSNAKDAIQWETIEALESIANQCIYTGKEVAKARTLLKALYKIDLEYDDDKPSFRENETERVL